MNKIPTPYLEDISESIARIEQYLAEIAFDKKLFFNDVEKQDSVIRRLEIIGEATKRLKVDFKDHLPTVPWRKMAGMRDVLIHDYDEVDLDLVWKVVTEELPSIKKLIEAQLGA